MRRCFLEILKIRRIREIWRKTRLLVAIATNLMREDGCVNTRADNPTRVKDRGRFEWKIVSKRINHRSTVVQRGK